jgi:hypothetical protein
MLGTRGKPPTDIGCTDYSMPSQHTKAGGGRGTLANCAQPSISLSN